MGKSVVGNLIAELRTAHGWTQAELGARAGFGQTLVSNREKGLTTPDDAEQDIWAKVFGISREQWDDMVRERAIHRVSPKNRRTGEAPARIPLYARVPAGTPVEGVDMPLDSIDRDDSTQSEGLIAVHVRGDSMVPALLDGDTVVLERINGYENHKPVNPGDAVCVRFSEESEQRGSEMFARVYPNADGTITLRKDNPMYPQVVVSRESIDAMWRCVQRRTPRI